jgi:cell wall-associated NlpC family hydrolase
MRGFAATEVLSCFRLDHCHGHLELDEPAGQSSTVGQLGATIGGDLVAEESGRRARKQQLPKSAAQSMPLMRRSARPYVWGGKGEPRFDCPGLTHGTFCGVYYAGGVTLPVEQPASDQ